MLNENKPKLKYSRFHKYGTKKYVLHYICLNLILEIGNNIKIKKVND